MKHICMHIMALVLTASLMFAPAASAAAPKADIFTDLTSGMLESYIAMDRLTEADIEDLVQYSDLSMSLGGINVCAEGTMYDGINSYMLFRLTPDTNETIMMDYACEPQDSVSFDDASELYESTGEMMNFRDFQAERGGSLKRVYLTVQMELGKDESFEFDETNYHDGSVIVRVSTMQMTPDDHDRVFTVRLEVSDCDDPQNTVQRQIAELTVPVSAKLTTLLGETVEAAGVKYNCVCYSSLLNGGGCLAFDISGLSDDAKERMAESFYDDAPLTLQSSKMRLTGLWFMDGDGNYVYEASQAALMLFSFRYVAGGEDLREIEYSSDNVQRVVIPLARTESAN